MIDLAEQIEGLRADLGAFREDLAAWLATCQACRNQVGVLDHIVRGNDRPGLDKRVDRLEQTRRVIRAAAWAGVVLASGSGGVVLGWFLQ